MSQKSVTLTISENISKPRNKLGQGLGVSVQLKKFKNLFRGFGIFSEIVRVTLFWDILHNNYVKIL